MWKPWTGGRKLRNTPLSREAYVSFTPATQTLSSTTSSFYFNKIGRTARKMNKKKLGDLYLKCKLVDWIIKNAKSTNYALSSELLFSEQKRYADIVKISKKEITAYEVKSKNDKLNRLQGQLDCYMSVFDYTYVVCHANHMEAVLKISNPHIGIIVEKCNKLSLIRRAKKSKKINSLSLLASYSRREMQIKFPQKLTSTLNIDELRQQISFSIKQYEIKRDFKNKLYIENKENTEIFIREIYPGKVNPDDLLILSRKTSPYIK